MQCKAGLEMGWKATCIFVNSREPGYLGTFPRHNAQFARELLAALPLPPHEPEERSSFDVGMYPKPGQLIVGAYSGAAVIGHDRLTDSCFNGSVPPVVEALQNFFPEAPVLAIQLHSVVNLFGYAYFEHGKLIRTRIGSANDGVFGEDGEPLPEEQALFAKSVVRNGERVFQEEIDGQLKEFSEAAFGEEFVLEISRRFLGSRIDEFDAWGLEMEAFKPVRRSLLRRIRDRLPWNAPGCLIVGLAILTV